VDSIGPAMDSIGQVVPGMQCCDGDIRSPTVERHNASTMRSANDAERRRRRDSLLVTGQMAFSGSSVQSRVCTGRPVHTACTGCAEASVAIGGLQGVE